MRLCRMLLVLSTAMLLAACGPQNPEEKLQDAAERVQEAKSDVLSASDDVTSARDDVESHRKAVRDAELDQSALLSDPELQNTAVYASVIDGSVFLYGEVVAEQQKIRAEEIARTAPGVSQIRSFIEIEGNNGQDP